LPAMAAAIVFPEEATPEALSDWNRVLVDLRGLGRAAPPIPRLGHHELEGEILRLQRASGTTKGGAVLRRFQKLGQGYDVVKGQEDLNAAAIAMITDDLKALTASVRRVLS
jgi:hypothetical protein